LNKFVPALLILVVIALLAWKTITEPKLLYGTWIILGFFAFRIVLLQQQKKLDAGEQDREGRE
jgi:hypothetical protein